MEEIVGSVSNISLKKAAKLTEQRYVNLRMLSDDETRSVWEVSNGGAMNGRRFNLTAEVTLPSLAFLTEKIEQGEEITLTFESELLSYTSNKTPKTFIFHP